MSESSWSGAFRPVLVVLGAAFLAAYSVLALWYPRPASVTVVAVSVLAVAWLAFLLDYAVRLALTARDERGHFVANNIVALLSIALPPAFEVELNTREHTTNAGVGDPHLDGTRSTWPHLYEMMGSGTTISGRGSGSTVRP